MEFVFPVGLAKLCGLRWAISGRIRDFARADKLVTHTNGRVLAIPVMSNTIPTIIRGQLFRH